MATLTFNDLLDKVAGLPPDDQDMLFEIVRKRRAEAWRKELAAYARKARRDFHAGKLQAESAEDLIARLRTQWSESDGR
ncbi:MAG TPA: hypothetical protein VFT34_03025 [Verrucomicrobiae bacterium]|nr:hypothetical protein [Verrucomicrobiae bacterium]